VAGQSIESVFLKLVGLSWENRSPLLLRKNNDPQMGPPRLAHLTISEYLRYNYISTKDFDNYYKFTFIRNPWCRIVSIYHYLGYDIMCDFEYFVSKYYNTLFRNHHWFLKPQIEFLNIENKISVDFIGRYERVQQDFNKICDFLEIERTVLPERNKSIKKYSDYRDYYNSTTIDKIFKMYRIDIQTFSYDF
jgi:hypothetical protein